MGKARKGLPRQFTRSSAVSKNKISSRKVSRPNIVWILIDSLRPDQLAQFGNNVERTYLDELIAQGTSFVTCISAAPYTIASEGATFTGFYPTTNKLDGWFKNTPYNLDKKTISFTEILKSEGYFCVSIYPIRSRAYVSPFGFDQFLMLDKGDSPNLQSLAGYVKAGSPKFCLIDFEGIHNECVRNPSFGRAEYHEVLKGVAKDVKMFSELLFREGSDTLIIISSDHGVRMVDDISSEPHKDERVTGKYLTDKTLKTLCTIIYHDKIPRGKIIKRMVRTIDIMPTILDILDMPVPSTQGVSLLPLINSNNFPELEALSITGGMGTSPWKPDTWCLRTEEWKIVKTEKKCEWSTRKKVLTYELYHLKSDPFEQIDCIKDFPKIAEKLKAALENYRNDKSTVKDYYAKGEFPYRKYLRSRYYPMRIRLKVFLNTLFRYKLKGRLKVQIMRLLRWPVIHEIIQTAKRMVNYPPSGQDKL